MNDYEKLKDEIDKQLINSMNRTNELNRLINIIC